MELHQCRQCFAHYMSEEFKNEPQHLTTNVGLSQNVLSENNADVLTNFQQPSKHEDSFIFHNQASLLINYISAEVLKLFENFE